MQMRKRKLVVKIIEAKEFFRQKSDYYYKRANFELENKLYELADTSVTYAVAYDLAYKRLDAVLKGENND